MTFDGGKPLRVLVVEAATEMEGLLGFVLAMDERVELVGSAGTLGDGLRLARAARPDLVVLGGGDADRLGAFLPRLRAVRRQMKVLAWIPESQEDRIPRLLDDGAFDVLLRERGIPGLLSRLWQLHRYRPARQGGPARQPSL